MTGTNELTDTLRFHCSFCGVELSVPSTLGGIEGPCPSCCATIRAPLPEAVAWSGQASFGGPVLPPLPAYRQFPDVRPDPEPAIPALVQTVMDGSVEMEGREKNFKARLAIMPPEDPLDDSWKTRHRDLRRQGRRVRRVEKAAQSFLESRAFQFARVALILLSAGMLAWLFQYLRSHQWQFPGLTPAVANDSRTGAPAASTRPVGDDVNELMADDDAEIPPAANFTPAPVVEGARNPLAGQPSPP